MRQRWLIRENIRFAKNVGTIQISGIVDVRTEYSIVEVE